MARVSRPSAKESLLIGLLIVSLLFSAASLKVAVHVSHRLTDEQRATAKTAHTACIRSRIFGPPLIDHLEAVEARLHTGALETPVEYPLGSKDLVPILVFYRSTIPKTCGPS